MAYHKEITIVIPYRKGHDPYITIASLKNQTLQNFEIITVEDVDEKGANWARNKGFEKVRTKYVLFSDNDIIWEPDAIENLYNTLIRHKHVSYVYGAYKFFQGTGHRKDSISNIEFDPELLKQKNYISTMSLIRSEHFPGFDVTLKRHQDWDLWLNLLINSGKVGVYCGKLIFKTEIKEGISFGNNKLSFKESQNIILRKYNLI